MWVISIFLLLVLIEKFIVVQRGQQRRLTAKKPCHVNVGNTGEVLKYVRKVSIVILSFLMHFEAEIKAPKITAISVLVSL